MYYNNAPVHMAVWGFGCSFVPLSHTMRALYDFVSHTQSYVGSVLVRLSNSKIAGSQFVPSFATSVIQSLVSSSYQDQSLVVSGHHTSGKTNLSRDILSCLLLRLEDPSDYGSIVLASVELLDLLCHTAEDRHVKVVSVITLLISTHSTTLHGMHFSSALLDTSNLSHMQVRVCVNHVCWYVCVDVFCVQVHLCMCQHNYHIAYSLVQVCYPKLRGEGQVIPVLSRDKATITGKEQALAALLHVYRASH